MSVPFGLDFGNLHSVIAVARNRGIDIIVNEVSNRSTPTLVGFGRKNRFIGESAKNQETSNLKNTVSSLKRLVGNSLQDPNFDAEKKYITAELVDADGTVGVEVNYLGSKKVFTATQLAAMYFNKIKEITAQEVKGKISDIVIAVPMWYQDHQRRALIDAAVIAGLNPVRIVNEVSAAAFGYTFFKTDLPEDKPKYVGFLDIGHASYEVSIAALRKDECRIIGAAYDKHFGGRDFDHLIAEHFADEFKTKYKIDIRSNPKAYSRVVAQAEKLKKILSANTSAPFNIESLMNDIDVSSSMTREQLEELAAPLLARATEPLERALKQANLTIKDLDVVETVGGCIRIPALKEKFTKFLGKPLSFTLNQDEAVARGATLICASHSPVFHVRKIKFEDINPLSVTFYWEKDAEDTDHLEVFPVGSAYPKTMMITLYRTKDFEITARYTPGQELVGGNFIGKWSFTGVKVPEGEDSATVRLKVRHNESGLYTIEQAFTVEEKEVEEEVPVEGSDEVTYKKVKKLVKKDDLVITHTAPGLDPSKKNEFIETENAMFMEDKLVAETENRKNALEEYIYELRGKIDEEYAPFATEEEKEKLKKKLMDTEEWLYEDGYDAKKALYVAKYEELASLGNLIKGRYLAKEEEKRQAALSAREQAAASKLAEKMAAERAQREKGTPEKPQEDAKMEDIDVD